MESFPDTSHCQIIELSKLTTSHQNATKRIEEEVHIYTNIPDILEINKFSSFSVTTTPPTF